MRFRSSLGVATAVVVLFAGGCGEGRKPADEPMMTDGPNQYVYSVPGMT